MNEDFMVMDFKKIKKIIHEEMDQYDHSLILKEGDSLIDFYKNEYAKRGIDINTTLTERVLLNNPTDLSLSLNNSQIVDLIKLQSSQIVQGNTILGVTGTAEIIPNNTKSTLLLLLFSLFFPILVKHLPWLYTLYYILFYFSTIPIISNNFA